MPVKSKRQEIFYRESDVGPTLDREIEKHVARLLHRSPVPWRNPPRYTAEIFRAQFLLDVVERREAGRTAVTETPVGWACSLDFGGDDQDLVVGRGDTEALAICAAFMSKRPRIRRKSQRGFAGRLEHGVRRFVIRVWNLRFVVRVRAEIGKLLFP
ncbi:MAG: hypothetical protein M3167_11820 [Acidobacteriota bacterium]|nr:hypothetical protein [Acidobacteriota bacterium]